MTALDTALATLDSEIEALAAMRRECGPDLLRGIELLAACDGRVIVSGIGKSGHVGAKIAATLASTGTPSFFIHSTEALHGDSGMATPDDVVILLSHSGTTAEVIQFGRMLEARGVRLMSITSNPASPLSRLSTVHISTSVRNEADPLALAPTSSTTCTLALGDALASGLMALNGFTPSDFARFHPGGALGAALSEESSR